MLMTVCWAASVDIFEPELAAGAAGYLDCETLELGRVEVEGRSPEGVLAAGT